MSTTGPVTRKITITKGVRVSATTGAYLSGVTVEVGTTVYFLITITNAGTVALDGVTLTDNLTDLVAACSPTTIPTTLAVGASFSCAYSAVAALGTRTNTATATADRSGSVSASAVVIGRRTVGITITKGVRSPDLGAYASKITVLAGTTVYFRIVVTNIGSSTATGLTLIDNLTDLAAIRCSIPPTLAPFASFTCTYSAVAADGTRTNTATADSAEAGPVSASAVVVGLTIRPALSITKEVGLAKAGPFVAFLDTVAGTPVFYRITIANVGNVPLTGVTLTDDLTDLHAAGCTIPTHLAVGQSYTCPYSGVAPDGQRTNTATAASIETGSVKTSAVVVGRTITPVLLITKTVSRSPFGPFVEEVSQIVGKLVYYRIVVTNAGNVPLTSVTLTDSLTDIAARGCAVFKGSLAVGASFTCQYATIVAAHPAPAINTAIATSAETPPSDASATVVPLDGHVFGLTSALAITKVIATGAGWPGGTFSFDVSCLARTVQVTVPKGQSSATLVLPDEIETGTVCTVVETGARPSAGTGYKWVGDPAYQPVGPGGVGSVVIIEADATVTVTVTNEREKIRVIPSPSPSPSGSHKPKPTDNHSDYYEPGSGTDGGGGSATGGILSVVAALFLAIALAARRRPASRDRRRRGDAG